MKYLLKYQDFFQAGAFLGKFTRLKYPLNLQEVYPDGGFSWKVQQSVRGGLRRLSHRPQS